MRIEKYATMIAKTKSIAPMAPRKNSNDGSGTKDLPVLLAFVMGWEL